ncbi:chemerin-like receptor 1 [Onychostoma macrolepis]|uniref:chemerin-like receptor 1 n=1 Tax=Onychostoma macrolepis TaxID=369639 RepID=UPI00272BB671|nr:chemerin-like receptor 1 [Onychostoma macrolepis]
MHLDKMLVVFVTELCFLFSIMEDTYSYSYEDYGEHVHPGYCRGAACVITVIFNVIIFLLGIIGNGAVIWITGFKMKKSVSSTWYLSLALSDFIFCATLPFTIDYIVKNSWNSGLFMCKLNGFVMPLNMYSSIFILVIISVHRCITVKFPVWAQNQSTVKKASIVVVLAWIVSCLLSIPSAKFRKIITIGSTDICYSDYENHHKTVVSMQFTFGLLIPFLTIFTCYCILIHKLRANQMSESTKPFKIMTLLIAAFFICWLPFQILSVLVLDISQHSYALYTALQVSVILASANSFLNPFIYAFMAKDLNKKCYSFLLKIESAIDEETQSDFRTTSIANSEDNRLSNAV